MLVIVLFLSSFLGGNSLKIPVVELPQNDPELICITNITRQYFAEAKSMVYLKVNSEFDILLKHLHSSDIISFNRKETTDIVKPNLAYMVVAKSVAELLGQNKSTIFKRFISEMIWNPYARFLIIFNALKTEELRQVFDIFLRYRINNVVVLNGRTTELFTYNPFENFACGRYYTKIIDYGKCSYVNADIYPNKAITGLRHCFFNVSVAHWPPWGIDPSKMNDPNVIGTEQYIFHLMSEIEQFKYKFNYDFDSETFSTVSKNLSITGPMLLLAQNQTDVMLGGLMLIPSRAKIFTYITGHLDYLDEIRIMVQRAGPTPAWKDIYFEFSATVWALLMLALLLYSILVAILLKKDKGRVFLVLLDSLLSHGSKFRCRQSVRCVVIIWVISAYLVNSFYTTTLMSLTTKPSSSYQISDEQAVVEQRLDPCISLVMAKYMKSEHNHGEILKDVEVGSEGCTRLIESVKTVSKSNRRFTIVLYSIYFINRQQFYNEYGARSVYSFPKPYTKVIYAIYFNKGFPTKERLLDLALRIRQTGLSEKWLKDKYYNQTTKYNFQSPQFRARFAIPWYLYAIGLFVSTITFVLELAYNH